MKPERRGDARTVRAAVRLFGVVARLLPARLRASYGAELAADFRRIARRGQARSGVAGVAFAVVRACADIVLRAPIEHWRERKGADRRRILPHVRRRRAGASETMEPWLREIRLAARTLARRPGFALVVILTLGLGIGANAAVVTVVRSVLIEPLAYPDSERIVMIEHHAPGLNLETLGASPGMVDLYREAARSFSHLAIVRSRSGRNLTGGERPARVRVVEASPEFFAIVGTRPVRGRAFGEADVARGAEPVAVLTHAGWRTHFGGDRDIVGRTVEFDGTPTRIVGVMPEGFHYPDPETVALLPRRLEPDAEFGDFGIGAIGRLAPGVTLEDARREVAALQARIPEAFPGEAMADFLERSGWYASVVRLRDMEVRDIETVLWLVLGTVAFVLLIACAGVANLFLVRADGRRAELAIRAALGASRARLAGVFVSESVLLGVAGGIVGMALTATAVPAIVASGPTGLPRLHEIAVDHTTLVYVTGLSLLVGLVLGLLPFARASGSLLEGGLRRERGGTAAPDGQRTRRLLIAGQVALALVLLTGSGLMLRSFERLRAVDPGVEPEGVLTVGVSLGHYASVESAASFYERVRERVAAIPGVEAVGTTNGLPLLGASFSAASAESESRPFAADDDLPRMALYAVVSPGYFEAMGIGRIEGRGVERGDHEFARRVVWVNETFAREFVDGEPLGERVRLSSDSTWLEIVGVVGDVRHLGLDQEVRPMLYLPLTTLPARTDLGAAHLAVRTSSGDPLALLPAVRRAVHDLRGDVPLTTARTMESIIDRSMARTSFTMTVLSIAAVVALFLGAVGLYGVISYAVSRRRREIGLRIALGARPGDVRRLVVRQGAGVVVIGLLAGLAAAGALTRLMGGMLFEVSAADPLAFGGAAVVLVSVGLLASWLPARRASAVSPMDALRAD